MNRIRSTLKSALFLLTCGLFLFVLVSCSRPEPPVSIRVGVTLTVDVLPYLVMREKGFDRAVGLRVTETNYAGGAAVVEAIANHLVDVGPSVGSVVVIASADRGIIPSVMTPVASESVSDLKHPGMGLLVSKSVTEFHQLEGQYIATNTRNSLGGIMLSGRLMHESVSSYKVVEMPFANQGLAVAGGNVAGATLPEPYLTQSLRRGDGRLLDWLTGEPPFARIPYTLVCFRTDFLKKKPEGAEKFLRAYLRAVKWTVQHEREARTILGKKLSIAEDVAQNMYLLEWPADGRNDPALLLPLETEMKDLGMIRDIVLPQKLYDESYLDRVLTGSR